MCTTCGRGLSLLPRLCGTPRRVGRRADACGLVARQRVRATYLAGGEDGVARRAASPSPLTATFSLLCMRRALRSGAGWRRRRVAAPPGTTSRAACLLYSVSPTATPVRRRWAGLLQARCAAPRISNPGVSRDVLRSWLLLTQAARRGDFTAAAAGTCRAWLREGGGGCARAARLVRLADMAGR